MDYIDSLKKVSFVVDGQSFDAVGGSFRGVPFFVENYERVGGGRRVVTKTIPFSNDFIHEDLGGEVPTFSMTIFLVGEECDKARDNLIAACSQEGTGELIHPYFGTFNARCLNLSFASGRTDLGYVRGEIRFSPETSADGRAVTQNLAAKTIEVAEASEMTLIEKFAEGFGIVQDGFSAASKWTKAALDKVAAVTDALLDAVQFARDALSTVNEFVNEIGRIKANIDVLLQTPGDFAARVRNLLDATGEIFGIESDKNDDAESYLGIMTADIDAPAGSPAETVKRLFVGIAAANLMKSVVGCKFDSVDDARVFSDKVSAAFDKMMESVSDVDSYMAFSDMQAAALGYMRESYANIAVVVDRTVVATDNVLSICYDTFGNLEKVEDIIARNSMQQGLFVTPGTVKVLSR